MSVTIVVKYIDRRITILTTNIGGAVEVKKRNYSLLISTFLAIILLLSPTTVIAENSKSEHVINFPDKALEAAVRKAINKPTGDILKNDVLNITYFQNDYDLYIESLEPAFPESITMNS